MPVLSGSPQQNWDRLTILSFFLASAALVIFLQVATARWIRPPDGRAAETAASERGSLHIRRRLQHASTGLLFWALSYVIPPVPGSIMLFSGAVALYAFHVARLRSEAAQELYLRLFGSLLRPHERRGLPGAFYFLLGTAATAMCCPMEVARLAVLCLSLADPAAAIAGTAVGGPRLGEHSSLGGSLACFGVSAGLGWALGFAASEAVVAAVAATGAEAVAASVRVDDNLLIPVAIGFALWAFAG